MTTDMMNLRDLVETAPDADLLREMIGYACVSACNFDPLRRGIGVQF
ncbi:hypothetical protein [Tabrizicola soli]|uniref:Uncharacterized protein n=1 Tax=Tabrizicola soli TaxID=2185115 RepID=A0ABV7DW71_9RHOB|nr:hypothetical protein [Tabrizicola soli]